MTQKTFLGLYKKDDIIPLELKFLALVGLCTFYALDGFIPTKTVLLGALLLLCLVYGRMQFLKLLRAIIISSFILLFFWAVFVENVSFATFIVDITDTIKSESYIRAIFRLFGLVIPGGLFMSVTSEYELLSTLKRYKAKPEITIFFVVTFNTIAHFITSYRTISTGYRMRVTKKYNAMIKLVYILTTLLFNCIILITKTKKVYYLYENRIIQTLLAERDGAFIDASKGKRHIGALEINIENVNYDGNFLSCLEFFHQTLIPGQCVALAGDVGSGKTTLLNIISGIVPNIINCDFSGDVLLDGVPLQGDDVDYVFQHSENSMFYDTVERQLCHINIKQRMYWLGKFCIDDLHGKAISDLSIGQKKMVSLISCLLSNAPVCLLDEPTAHLDDDAIDVFLTLLNKAAKGKIIIVTSHDKPILDKFDIQISLTNRRSLSACEQDEADDESVVLTSPTKTIASVKHLSYSYPDGTKAISDVNIEICGGEIIGLLGANGSGKSTFSMLLAEAAMGRIKDTAIQFSKKCFVAIMLQNTDLQFFTTSVLQELQFGLPFNDSKKERAAELLQIFGLSGFSDEPPQFLSEGQKKCLLIICMLLAEPDVLILDEPFDSLDAAKRRCLKKALSRYLGWTDNKKAIIINDQNDVDIGAITTKRIELPSRIRWKGK